MSSLRKLKILPLDDQPPQQQTKRFHPMTPKTLMHIEDNQYTTPKAKSANKASSLLVKISPKLTKKRDTAPLQTSIATERLMNSPSASPSRRSLFRLKKPGEIRVTTQSLRSLNFSSTIRLDETDEEENEEAQLTKRLHEPIIEENVVSLDEMPHETCGDEAIDRFYSHYKQLDKVCDINGFKSVKNAMYTTFLKKTEDLRLFPAKIGLVKEKGTKDRLKIK